MWYNSIHFSLPKSEVSARRATRDFEIEPCSYIIDNSQQPFFTQEIFANVTAPLVLVRG